METGGDTFARTRRGTDVYARDAAAIAAVLALAACEDGPDVTLSGDAAPRGVAALGGEGENLVRYAPVPGADEHRVYASRDGSFDDPERIEHAEPGAAVHRGLETGERVYYRVAAEGAEGFVASEKVSAAPQQSDRLSLHIEMAPRLIDELYDRDPHSNERLDAEVAVGAPDGPALDVRGLRFRGATTRFYAKKNFNIRTEERPALPEYPDFNFRDSGSRRAGDRIAINALWTDPTAMREALNFEMFHALGLVAPSYYFTDVYINGAFEGLYFGVERVDRELLRGWGLNPESGEHTLVRDEAKGNRHLDAISRRSIFGQDIDAALDGDEEAIELLQEVFRYRGDAEEHNWEAVLELIRWVGDTPPGEPFEDGFRERFDVDAFIDFLAIHALTHDRDVLDIDYWLYRNEVEEGPWYLIPWDKNLTFGAHYFGGFQGVNDFLDYDRVFIEAQQNDIVDKFLATPGLREDFEARLSDLATEVFDDAWYREHMEAIAESIAPAMARLPDEEAYAIHPGQHHGAVGWWEAHKRALRDFVRLRRAWLLSYLDEEDPKAARGHRVVADDHWVIAEFHPEDEASEDAEIEVEVTELGADSARRGIDREWTVTSSRPARGELVLYWKNTPVESWYDEDDPVIPGNQWYLEGFAPAEEGGWARVEGSEAQPFSNAIRLPVELDGERRLRVGYPE